LSKVQHRPVGHRCTKNHPGIPYSAGHHSRSIEPLIIIPQILDQLDGSHAGFHRGCDLLRIAAHRQVVSEPQHNLGFHPEPAVVMGREHSKAVMDPMKVNGSSSMSSRTEKG